MCRCSSSRHCKDIAAYGSLDSLEYPTHESAAPYYIIRLCCTRRAPVLLSTSSWLHCPRPPPLNQLYAQLPTAGQQPISTATHASCSHGQGSRQLHDHCLPIREETLLPHTHEPCLKPCDTVSIVPNLP
jgi:hypothetical protein